MAYRLFYPVYMILVGIGSYADGMYQVYTLVILTWLFMGLLVYCIITIMSHL